MAACLTTASPQSPGEQRAERALKAGCHPPAQHRCRRRVGSLRISPRSMIDGFTKQHPTTGWWSCSAVFSCTASKPMTQTRDGQPARQTRLHRWLNCAARPASVCQSPPRRPPSYVILVPNAACRLPAPCPSSAPRSACVFHCCRADCLAWPACLPPPPPLLLSDTLGRACPRTEPPKNHPRRLPAQAAR